ncbi:MAG: hypothetical protein K0S33_3773 [Bacteroidetes bacterium]|jgi:hypothetical protein|nr:hypothetical protein [Bacteroidota bacterium]
MRIHQLTDEIKHHHSPTRKSAYEIFRILDNNKTLFLSVMDVAYVQSISTSFEELSDSHPSTYGSPSFIRDFEQHYQSLLYNLDKII